ncbi:MAG: chemotaxis protein CheW [Prevotellaceae bacterium]|jgi:two-component system chemotaxis response regulator CheV|nr:chemotaxis protein CheW [Prevotellaceae bacterium]
MDKLKLLEFSVGQELYGINIENIEEIIRVPDITPLPSSPAAVTGVFIHRDTLITAIDLHTAFGIRRSPDTEGLLIISNCEGEHFAFHVEAVYGIHELSPEQVDKRPTVTDENKRNIVAGVAHIDNKRLTILDSNEIVYGLFPHINRNH